MSGGDSTLKKQKSSISNTESSEHNTRPRPSRKGSQQSLGG